MVFYFTVNCIILSISVLFNHLIENLMYRNIFVSKGVGDIFNWKII